MKYSLVINMFAPDAAKQAGQLTGFLADNKLHTENGTCVIIYNPEFTDTAKLQEVSALVPAARIFYASFKEYLTENVLMFLEETLVGMDYIFFPGTYFGEELSVRLSVRLKGSSLTGVQSVRTGFNKTITEKKIYSGHITGTFELHKKPYILSIDKNYRASSDSWNPSEKEMIFKETKTLFPNPDIEKSPLEKEAGLEDAPCVAIAGRGLKNKENTLQAESLASQINIPLAGSRPCVMNAWLPLNRLIGVSGTMIAPNVCILLGVSGAPALYSGIEKSSYIISINNDPDAPIVKKSDVAVCGDAIEIFGAFTKLLGGAK